jgi:N-acetylneuraminic acid mutarotase
MVRTNDHFAWHSVEHDHHSGPPPSCCQSMVEFGDKLYVFGGAVLGTAYNHVFSFDLKNECWQMEKTRNSSLASNRMSHTAVVFENRMVVFGGMDLTVVHSDLLSLDLQTMEWSVLPSEGTEHPGTRRSHAAAIYGRTMFVSMGVPSQPPPDLWSYDFDTRRWKSIPTSQRFGVPPVPVHGHTLGVHNDSLFMFGGCIQSSSGQMHYSNSLHQYHIKTNFWSQVRVAESPRPPPRYSHVMAIANGMLVIHGGDTDNCTKYFDDLWVLNLDAACDVAVWTKRSTGASRRPCSRSGHCAAVHEDELYIFGGEAPGSSDAVILYSGQLYRFPLSLSTRIPLAELCGRWLSKSFGTDDAMQWLSPSASGKLRRHHCIQIAEILTEMPQI